MNPAMLKLFLRSARCPQHILDAFDLIEREGLSAFAFKPMAPDDAAWGQMEAPDGRPRTGLWVRSEGKTSRVTAAIFMEGVSDEVVSKLESLVPAAGAALPAGA